MIEGTRSRSSRDGLVEIALATDLRRYCAEALAAFEPHVPWEKELLEDRVRCYETLSHDLLPTAKADRDRFLAASVPSLDEVLAMTD